MVKQDHHPTQAVQPEGEISLGPLPLDTVMHKSLAVTKM